VIQGLYDDASSLDALLQRQEAYSQNLANVSTPGFKQEITRLEAAPDENMTRVDNTGTQSIGALSFGVDGSALTVDYSQGPIENTGHPLDLAIIGNGFFQVQTPQGLRLTRDGTFHKDSAGNIVTADGNYLLGTNGPIKLGTGDPTILEDGTIYMPGATAPTAQIALGTVANPAALVREDQNLLDPAGAAVQPVAAGIGTLKQGSIEQSNVDLSGVTVGMMQALRTYEAVQRSIQMQDTSLQQLMTVGQLS
jgi:flagellar basal-body rod protein FlgG